MLIILLAVVTFDSMNLSRDLQLFLFFIFSKVTLVAAKKVDFPPWEVQFCNFPRVAPHPTPPEINAPFDEVPDKQTI